MKDPSAALHSVAAAPPALDPALVSEALVRDYGLRGELLPLVSERDQNFRLTAPDGSRFVAKIVSSVEDPAVTEFQIAALLHLEEQGILGVPRIIRNLADDALSGVQAPDGTRYTLRVTNWLPGEPLDKNMIDKATARALGQSLARLDRALANFRHAADQPVLLWNMQRAAELVDLTWHITDPTIRRPVRTVLETFRDQTAARLEALPKQVIHNDANPSNVLLAHEPHPPTRIKVTATLSVARDRVAVTLIDFGDMMRSARVVEVATAAAYLRVVEDPLRFVGPLVSAYHDDNPLTPAELDLIFDLIRTRLAMTTAILYWRLSARDENDPYRRKSLASEQDAPEFLEALDALGRKRFDTGLKRELVAG
ncbi:MAG TPA: phosphotransferase [Woeseiaceae bacterium]|nr:phosphotransferase [Woeseiaceae bacterium]